MQSFVAAAVAAMLWPSAAGAVTSPANSTVPGFMLLVGHDQGVPDTTTGVILIVARDFANNPVVGRTIEVRLLNCPGARLAQDQLQPGVSTRCATHGVTAVTNQDGIVRFAVLGGGDQDGPPGAGPCVQIYSGGLSLGAARVAYLDLDGRDGLGAQDMSIWLTDFGTGEPIGRSDFNGDQVLTADDLSLWLMYWGEAHTTQSPATYCP